MLDVGEWEMDARGDTHGRLETFGAGLSQARERADSELHALAQGLSVGPGSPARFRKWLGWALFRLAAWVNPEVADS